jgi:plasmid stabilization system protein ParE
VKRLKVNVPLDVQQQILEQMFYISQHSIDNALAWENRVRAAIEAIGEVPGHPVDEEASRRAGETIRKVVFERTYLIHYWIDDSANAVEIVNFRHGARVPRVEER